MMAPLPTPGPFSNRDFPRPRLDVRAASGRASTYDFTRDEFLIGAAPGCDLRLSGNGVPPVVLQLLHKPDGVRIRRVAAALPVLLNSTPLPAGTVHTIQDGDSISLAGITIAVHVPVPPQPMFLSPKLIPLDEFPLAEPLEDETAPVDLSEAQRELAARRIALDAEETERRAAWESRDADMLRRQRELDRLAEELQADRAEWHDRRRKIEQELADHRAEETARVRAELESVREQWLDECNRLREELLAQRQQLDNDLAAFEPSRQLLRAEEARVAAQSQELERQQGLFRSECESIQAKQAAENERLRGREAALAQSALELTEREAALQAARSALEQEQPRLHDDFVRLERRAAAVEEAERQSALKQREVDSRVEQLIRDSAEWEETVRLAAAEQERLRAEAERLDRQKVELDAQSATLAERAAQIEAQQAVVAVFQSKLDRSRQEMEREAWQLAAARVREDESQAELRKRIQEAEELRAALSAVQADAEQERQRLDERDSLLTTALEEIRVQKEALAAQAERLQHRELELDSRTAEFAEQAGMLKGRMTQALDLQSRLEADRVAIREREAALSQSEAARLAFQEQLRRRAEELAERARTLEEASQKLTAERAALTNARAELEASRITGDDELAAARQELEARSAELARQTAEFAEKENALARQIARLKEVGAAVAAERKALVDARAADEKERAELDAFRKQVAAELESLRLQAPELDDQAKLALERLAAGKEMLRGQLNELHEFARTSRTDLESARTQLQSDFERLRTENAALARAKDEHRLAVAAFRQQIVEWQGIVAEIRRQLATSETRLDAKTAAATEAATAAVDATRQLAEETDRLRREREELTAKRTVMERHLADMREWYRKKLRELARGNEKGLRLHEASEPASSERRVDGDAAHPGPVAMALFPDELEPGDRQLGELLQSLGLVDGDTLASLWSEGRRQRRTLRQVLLASNAITLYQLALIEAGNLDALVLDRFRVIDRLRSGQKETVYRVFDPRCASEKGGGIFLLRHLGEAEAADAVHPDEFRQRFSAARDAVHPNLAAVIEVLEINGRPAVVQEWLTGLFSADWPPFAAHPGCWVRLATMAAGALDAAHRVGLVHGRLTSDSFLLTPDGVVKVTGFGEPTWLGAGAAGMHSHESGGSEITPAADLRAFGQVLFGWSQLAGRKRVAKSKAFPEVLWGVIRRLEADAEPPMADTVAAARPYDSAAELLAELQLIARETSFSDDAWARLLKYVVDHAPDAGGIRKAG